MPKRRVSCVIAGLMDLALMDQVPERITGHAVRDHRDRHTGGVSAVSPPMPPPDSCGLLPVLSGAEQVTTAAPTAIQHQVMPAAVWAVSM
jgi:hypothetical protein